MNGPERRATAQSAAAAVTRVNRSVAEVSGVIRRNVRRGLRPLGVAGAVPMDVIDAHHAAVHGLIGAASGIVGDATGAALEASADPDAPSLFDGPGATDTITVTQAAFGDVLPDPLNPRTHLVEKFPAGSDDAPLVVLVHGLGGHQDQFAGDYLTAFADTGFEVTAARYSSGRPIAENGRHLADAVSRLARTPRRIVFVGHSMGGLVVSEALATDPAWLAAVDTVVTLGSPFRGAPLERFARTALRLGSTFETAAPIIALGDHRSVGIKDLGDGTGTGIPAGIRHIAVVGMLGSGRRDLTSITLGDGMVPLASAGGLPTAHSEIVDVTEAGHLDLLRNDAVAQVLRDVAGSQPTAR